jgi:hypothetical protein
MDHTVKFRLRGDEYDMLTAVARERALSSTLRDLIHDEYHRMRHPE